MDHPFTCKFATAMYKDLTTEIIQRFAKNLGVKANTVSGIQIERYYDLSTDFIKSHCKGPNSILTIDLTEAEGSPEECLSKLMDNTRGCLRLIEMQDQLDVGLVIFHGQVPPALWGLNRTQRIICDNHSLV